MGAKQMSAHSFRTRALSSFIGRLIEIARWIKPNCVLYAAGQQVKQSGRVVFRIEFRADLVVGPAAPEFVVLARDSCWVLENHRPQTNERFQGIANDVRGKPPFGCRRQSDRGRPGKRLHQPRVSGGRNVVENC
jgi:hypothetical protein